MPDFFLIEVSSGVIFLGQREYLLFLPGSTLFVSYCMCLPIQLSTGTIQLRRTTGTERHMAYGMTESVTLLMHSRRIRGVSLLSDRNKPPNSLFL